MRIGIDLGGTNVRVALVDEKGIVKLLQEPTKSEDSVEESLGHIKGLISQLMTPEVRGIGIGVPSVVDPIKGIVYDVANIASWKEVHIKDLLEKEFKVPTFVNNDANCFALGEKFYGAAKGYKDVVGITLGTGVGAGLIFDNNLYIGSNTGAGEVGCIKYLNHTMEDYCGSMFFVREHATTGKEMYDLAEKGDAKALNIWKEFGRHMGNLITTVLFAYDPEVIVFGGSIASAYKFFKEAMYKELKNFPYNEVVPKLKIEVSSIDNVGILGAASLVSLD